MKKKFFSLLCILAVPMMMATAVSSTDDGDPILFVGSFLNPTDPLNPNPKSPVKVPVIYLDGYTLDFVSCCDGSTLRLLDDTKTVVYSLVIPKRTTLLNLPASLKGTYIIQIIRGNWLFTGEIELN